MALCASAGSRCKLVRIKDRADVTQRMAGQCCDLRFGTANQREPCYCCAAQIVEGHSDNAGAVARLKEGHTKSVGRPWLAFGVYENDR